MKKVFFSLLFSLLCCGVLEGGDRGASRRKRADRRKIAQPGNIFALNIYKKLAEGKKGNVVFSSFSLYEALSMANLGAVGVTEKQMAKVLHIRQGRENFYKEASVRHKELLSLGKSGVALLIANALFADSSVDIAPAYQAELKKYYLSKMYSLDFRNDPQNACAKLNKWISSKTKGKIKGMLNPNSVPERVSLYLVNAIYFKGDWASKFKKRNTIKSDFTCLDGKKIQVPTMYQQNEFHYAENDKMQFLGMRYKGKSVSMGIILPRAKIDFSEFEKELDIVKFQVIVTDASTRPVKVFLPRFKFRTDMSLNEPLKELGMKKAFDDLNAEFNKVGRQVYISKVMQRAELEVNETGAVAVAATYVEEDFFGEAPPSKTKVFRANRPFLFFIQDKATKTILFYGRVVKP